MSGLVASLPNLLETVMLICFGCSWPLSVIKNVKAKTAKSMSLGFILLITFGYIAGITGKIVAGKINYVLVVYFINLIFVSMNIVVYFINRKLDKERESENK